MKYYLFILGMFILFILLTSIKINEKFTNNIKSLINDKIIFRDVKKMNLDKEKYKDIITFFAKEYTKTNT